VALQKPVVSPTALSPAFSRGPRPPAAVCPRCKVVVQEPWVNPLLAWLAQHGRNQGETTGGYLLCAACDEALLQLRRAPPSGGALPVPAIFREARWETYELTAWNARAVETARRWCDQGAREGQRGEPGPARDLYIYGPTGVGKSRLAATLANEYRARRGEAVAWLSVPALAVRMRLEDDQRGATWDKLDWASLAGLLVLDDLGVADLPAGARLAIETVYQARLDAGRRTIVTSNVPLGTAPGYIASLADRWDRDLRLVSRLAGACTVIELAGDDQRLARRRRSRTGKEER
jgi:DNA replication protein DnaC